jgi:Domain of unknown function (DUF4410)
MKLFSRIVLCIFVIAAIIGCASSTITSRQEYTGGKIARPDHIIVYDFAATPADVPAESAIAGQYSEHSSPQTAEQIAAGRQVGAEIAQVLVQDIRGMGLPAEQASSQTSPQIGDLVIKGTLLSIDEGSAAKRAAIGFGSGASELKVAVEGFLMTDRGLRKLGSGTADSSGSKSPGAALGVVGAIATANPAGLIISSGMKVYGEASGSSAIEGRAKDMANEIAKILQAKFKEQGWI